MRPGTWIICLYPQGWRQRYEEEMVALLEQHTVTLATHFDLLLGALDAHLDPSYRTEKALFLFKDERTTATTFLCAYAIFLFAMYNWHHYIPLTLSLTPYYLDTGMLSTQVSSPEFTGVSNDSLLAMSDFVMQVTLLASNLFFIAVLVKQAKGARRKRFVLPAVLCLVLLFALPLLPLLGVYASTATLTNPSGIILPVAVRPLDQIVELYKWSFRLLCPLLTLLISSLFIAIIRIREVITAPRKQWLLLATMFYLILPIGRMLLLNSSVQIPSTISPISTIILGTALTYFPPFAGLATMVLAIASNEGSKRMWRIALLPATVLSLVMLTKLIMTLIMLPLIWQSVLLSLSPWDSLSVFTLTTMLLVMFIAGGIMLIALMRGFVALKTTEPYTQTDANSALTQSASLIQ
jgi:hypothetical protein